MPVVVVVVQQRRHNKSSMRAAGFVYAVASGARPGIYFQWNGSLLRGVAQPKFESFPSIDEARRYLAGMGLVPIVAAAAAAGAGGSASASASAITDEAAAAAAAAGAGGWISTTSRDPILYKKKKKKRKQEPAAAAASASSVSTEDDENSARPTSSKYFSGPQSPQHGNHQKRAAAVSAVSAVSAPATAATTAAKLSPSLPNKRQRSSSAPSTAPNMEMEIEIQLDAIQQRAIDAALDNQNVFLTGVAGTGKSLVTKLIYEQALERFGSKARRHMSNNNNNNKKKNKKVALCAPTGMAAVGLGLNGQTIHTLAGIKVPLRASDFSSMRSPGNEKKWKALECLIIDEVGMLSADFLDWLDWNVRQIRHRPLEPFGGIQLIFVGDFAQLGPVPGSLSLKKTPNSRTTAAATAAASGVGPPYPPHQAGADCFLNIHETTAFAFQSVLWREADFCHVHLTQVYRQTDRAFVAALTDLREQRPESAQVADLVQKCATPLDDTNARQQVFGDAALEIPAGLLPTLLYTNNRNADRENGERLASLCTEHKRFVAQDGVQVDTEDVPPHIVGYVSQNLQKNKFFDQCQASKNLDLKIGAQVMLVQNLSTEEELVNGSRGVVEKFVLVPVLRDFKGTEEFLLGPEHSEFFPEGKTYEQLDFKTVFHFKDKTWKMCRKVKYPLVRFLNNKTKIILPSTFERTLFRQGTCRRLQLPLRLSWALTIHKAQGCTLDWLICDLAGCFTAGQAYVALSRAKSMAGLQIRNFSQLGVFTNPLVHDFYQALAADTVSDFLRDRAGLWWYPILDHPEWHTMFTEASSTAGARANAETFRHWVANYQPPDNYQGWKGYNEQRKHHHNIKKTPPPTNVRSPLHPTQTGTEGNHQQHRTVTPTTVQTTLPCSFQTNHHVGL